MIPHETYMYRCLELARQGSGHVAPNPMVGAVLVHGNRIIGEGWHRQYGQAHAEVNCIESVHTDDQPLIAGSTLYVSLEPCAHFGKTPPCTDLIIRHKIPQVVIGCVDTNSEVSGKGIEKLREAGIAVVTGVLENECRELNKRFFTYHEKRRPFVILKWAETIDGFIAPRHQGDTNEVPSTERLLISNEFSNRLVHRWRSEEAAILVGTNTALLDDPELTTRLWPGPSPVRLVLDMDLKLPATLKIFNRQVRTVIVNGKKDADDGLTRYYRVSKDAPLVPQLLHALYDLQLQSVLVEGGAGLLNGFIDAGTWDEARRIVSGRVALQGKGLPAPQLRNAVQTGEERLDTDHIFYYRKNIHGDEISIFD